jgi:hypothetical protein
MTLSEHLLSQGNLPLAVENILHDMIAELNAGMTIEEVLIEYNIPFEFMNELKIMALKEQTPTLQFTPYVNDVKGASIDYLRKMINIETDEDKVLSNKITLIVTEDTVVVITDDGNHSDTITFFLDEFQNLLILAKHLNL